MQKLKENVKHRLSDWLQEIFTDIQVSHPVRTDKLIQLRNFIESFFYELTVDCKEKFPNLYSRIIFVAELYRLDENLISNIQAVRKHINKALVEDKSRLSISDISSYFFYIIQLVRLFEIDLEQEEFDWVNNFTPVNLISSKESALEQIDEIIITVKDFTAPTKSSAGWTCQVTGTLESTDTNITIELTDIKQFSDKQIDYKYGRLLGNFSKLIWNGCKVKFFNLNLKDSDSSTYENNSSTQIILEPDFLVDATSIANCFQSKYADHKTAVFSLLENMSISTPLVKGNFVNQMLDKMVIDNEVNFTQLFIECVHYSILTSLSLGIPELMNIMKDVKENHFDNMQRVTAKFNGLDLTIEPTFYSPEYGIYGRLDGLIEGENDDPTRKSIFELKSGKTPYNGVWKSHEIQVAVYNILLRSTFGDERTGSSMIFYSSDNQSQLRNVTSTPLIEQHILMVRNCIVSEFYKFATGELDIIDYVTSYDESKLPIYKVKQFNIYKHSFNELTEIEENYYREYFAFLMRELWSAKTGYFSESSSRNYRNYGFSSIWKNSQQEKMSNSRVLTNLEFLRFNDNKLVFKLDNDIENSSIRVGDRIILYPFTDTKRTFTTQVLKCSITEINSSAITLNPKNALINNKLFATSSRWNIEFDANDFSSKSLIASLTSFICSENENRDLLLGNSKPKIDENFIYNEASNYLNPIITKALAAKDYFLLQGPPGTGKTSSFLIKCVDYLFNNTTETIVILSFTNRAIDEVCTKLNSAKLPYLRLGTKNDETISSIHDLSKNNDKLSSIEKKFKSYRIFCATVASYHSSKEALHSIVDTNALFIDEASQLLEPDVIGITANFDRFIMIGDQIQLPAITTQSVDNQNCGNANLNSIGIKNFGQSLFERLFENAESKGWEDSYHTLEYHYRMHGEIAELINPFYRNNLKVGLDKQQTKNYLNKLQESEIPFIKNRLSASRTIFIDVPDRASSKVSENEANIVIQTIQHLLEFLGDSFNEKSIGVICPWRSQINLIKSKLISSNIEKEITIDTVERFQGSERDIVIYSLATNFSHQLENLQSLSANRNIDRKLNVALSRSIEQIILVGNASILQQLPQYKAIIEVIKQKGLFIDFKNTKTLFI